MIYKVERANLHNNTFKINGFVRFENDDEQSSKEISVSIYLQNHGQKKEIYYFQVASLMRKDLSFIYGSDSAHSGFEAILNLDQIDDLLNKKFNLFMEVVNGDFKKNTKLYMPHSFFYEFDPALVFNVTNYRREIKRQLESSIDSKIRGHVENSKRFVTKTENEHIEDFVIYKNQIKVYKDYFELNFHRQFFNNKEVVLKVNDQVRSRVIIKDNKACIKIPNILSVLNTTMHVQMDATNLKELDGRFLFDLSLFASKYRFIKNTFIFRNKNSTFGWFLLKAKIEGLRK